MRLVSQSSLYPSALLYGRVEQPRSAYSGGHRVPSKKIHAPAFAGNALSTGLIDMVVGLGFAKLIDGCFAARPEWYKTLEQYSAMPPQQARGEALLKQTSREASPCRVTLAKAEALFLEAACTALAHVDKAHAYRHAAMAAKLRGEQGKAAQYMAKSIIHRKKSDNDSNFYQGPVRDIAAFNRTADFPLNRFIHVPRTIILMPIISLVAFLERLFRKKATPLANRLRQLFMPFQTAKERMQTRLTERFNALEGEADDAAWISGGLPPSLESRAGQGFWRKYVRSGNEQSMP